MIDLDTNVLVRYLAQDDLVQARHATQIIERQLTEQSPGFISIVTMVETAWVLNRVYHLSDREVAAAIERILQADTLLVQNEQEVFTAMVFVLLSVFTASPAILLAETRLLRSRARFGFG